MNLFDLHDKPETLKGWKHRYQVPDIAYEEALEHYNKTGEIVPELEPAIAKSAEYAYKYAAHILSHKRFHKGEDAIATSPWYAYLYAKEIIRKRWPKGEKAIAKDPQLSLSYAFLIKKRFPLGEPTIALDPHYRAMYNQRFKTNLGM